MGRKPIGAVAMTAAERQVKRRRKMADAKENGIIELIAKSIFEGKSSRKWEDADPSEQCVFLHTAKLAFKPVKKFFGHKSRGKS